MRAAFIAAYRDTFRDDDQGAALKALYAAFSLRHGVGIDSLRELVAKELKSGGYSRLRKEQAARHAGNKAPQRKANDPDAVVRECPRCGRWRKFTTAQGSCGKRDCKPRGGGSATRQTAANRPIADTHDGRPPSDSPLTDIAATALVRSPSQPNYPELEPSPIDKSFLPEIAENLAYRHTAYSSADEINEQLQAFVQPPCDSHGYLSWRFSELATRPGHSAERSAAIILDEMSSIVADAKEIIASLTKAHGDILADPEAARAALNKEFRRIDVAARWSSASSALRRSRASLGFLRKAVVLTFGSGDYTSNLLPLLGLLQPPDAWAKTMALPPHVVASVANLRRTVTLVDRLFSAIDAESGGPYTRGLDELIGLRRGDFDWVLIPHVDTVASPALPTSRLPLMLLPPGERIHPFIAGLKRSGRYRDGEVDPRRLDVLAKLWAHLSESGTCTVYEGAFPANGRDNGYLVLAIAYEGYGEDAVAISPWRGEHATFVVRADCGAHHSWRTVLTKAKEEAKELGARRLVFKSNLDFGIDEYEAMFQKVVALFACSPAEFEGGVLHFDDYAGRYEIR